jgi:hypothetical protein
MLWATRLAAFLLFRVLKMGSDARFDAIRGRFWGFAGFWGGQVGYCVRVGGEGGRREEVVGRRDEGITSSRSWKRGRELWKSFNRRARSGRIGEQALLFSGCSAGPCSRSE